MRKLDEIAFFVSENIRSSAITIEQYITTDCLLQNKNGRIIATNLPPKDCSLIKYRPGDVLIANIRPYLKKIWYADIEGGASADVLVLRAKDGVSSKFLYAVLLQDPFYDFAMKGAKGSKMPRGDKNKILCFPIVEMSKESESKIGGLISTLDRKISLNRSINAELEQMAKEIYDYWFVQFDFPDEHGRPYKSSSGKMVYNPVLKREIPEGWEVKSLKDIATFTNGLACQKFRPTDENKLPVIKIREMHGGFTAVTEFVKSDIPEKVKVYNGDVLFSWSASLEVMLWAYGNGGLNQHIFKVTSNNGWPKSFYYYQLLSYVDVFKKMAEARKTTMGHITEEHLEQSRIAVPSSVSIAVQLDSKLAPIFEKIIATSEEITMQEKQRDSLLPLLMTGQV